MDMAAPALHRGDDEKNDAPTSALWEKLVENKISFFHLLYT
jgi:hypothetical protein